MKDFILGLLGLVLIAGVYIGIPVLIAMSIFAFPVFWVAVIVAVLLFGSSR